MNATRRIDRTRTADEVHRGDVLAAVGIEIALVEGDPSLEREALHRSRLARRLAIGASVSAQVVTVVGPHGVGKSHLIAECRRLIVG